MGRETEATTQNKTTGSLIHRIGARLVRLVQLFTSTAPPASPKPCSDSSPKTSEGPLETRVKKIEEYLKETADAINHLNDLCTTNTDSLVMVAEILNEHKARIDKLRKSTGLFLPGSTKLPDGIQSVTPEEASDIMGVNIDEIMKEVDDLLGQILSGATESAAKKEEEVPPLNDPQADFKQNVYCIVFPDGTLYQHENKIVTSPSWYDLQTLLDSDPDLKEKGGRVIRMEHS